MKVETENSIENNEVKCLCFEKINKTDKTLYTLIKESREEAHYQYKKNESSFISKDLMDIKWIMNTTNDCLQIW